MRRLLSVAIVAATTSLAFPAFAQDKSLDGDMKKLQGKWTTKGPGDSPIVLTFDGAKVSIKLVAPSGEERVIAGDFNIDEKATPKAMTWTHVKVVTRDVPDLTAIYAFTDDDTLKIAGVGGGNRPKEFIEKGKELPGIRPNTMVLSRAKDEPKK